MDDGQASDAEAYGFLVAATNALLDGLLSLPHLAAAVECLEMQDLLATAGTATVPAAVGLPPAEALQAAATALRASANAPQHLLLAQRLRRLALEVRLL